MLRLGLIGTDGGAKNGHSLGVVRTLNKGGINAKVVALMGNDEAETEALVNVCNGEAKAYTDVDAFLDACDAVMVMHRNGIYHTEYAIKALEAGKPVFVDKPLACSVEDAERIIEAAKANSGILHSGSSVGNAPILRHIKHLMDDRGEVSAVYISFPLTNKPEFGGIHFYTHHILSGYSALFEQPIKSVYAMEVNGNIVVTADCEDFPAIFNYAAGYDSTQIGIYFKDGTAILKDLSGYSADEQLYDFVRAVEKNEITTDFEEQLLPVKVTVAMEKSLESGLRVTV